MRPIAAEAEAAHDPAVVDDLVRLHNSGGAAVLERQGVERALANGQVRTLVLPFTLDDDEYDTLIVQAVVNGAEVEFVHGDAAGKLQEYGGIGARLYYAVN